MERKIFPAFQFKVDADQGIVEHIVAVMGNIDQGDDVIHPGAFTKTISERGRKVRVLDHHNTNSIMNAIGKPIMMREVGKNELPLELVSEYPDATGALVATTQFLMDTPEGKGAFIRIKEGAVDEYSIGYDAVKGRTDYSKAPDGRTVRNLRELKLYEYSPVLWGMNEATTTLSAKDKGEPSEGKPYGVFMDGDQHCVYKLDEDGERMGESLGCHDAEDDAMAQMRALYAEEKDDKEAEDEEAQDEKAQSITDVLDDVHRAFRAQFPENETPMMQHENEFYVDEVFPEHAIVCSYGESEYRYYSVAFSYDMNGEIIFAPKDQWVGGDYVFTPGVKSEVKPIDIKAGRVLARRNADRIMNAMNLLHEALTDAGLMDMEEEDEDKSLPAPEKAADKQPISEDAAPPEKALTSKELELIEISLRELELLEV